MAATKTRKQGNPDLLALALETVEIQMLAATELIRQLRIKSKQLKLQAGRTASAAYYLAEALNTACVDKE